MSGFTADSYALSRIAHLVPREYNESRFPTARQCVGTNRLWGAPLGSALFHDIDGSIEKRHLVDIAILSRAILVTDDHIDDEYLDSGEIKCLSEFKEALERELFCIYESIGAGLNVHNELCAISKQEVEARRNGESEAGLYRSAINRCLIFFNPYRLESAQKNPAWEGRIHFLETFFFACQLLDDFQDLSEDRVKRTNQNIFYYKKSEYECDLIEKSCNYWAPSLLGQILLNLRRNDVIVGASNSAIFQAYHRAAVEFLMLMLSRSAKNVSIDDGLIMRFEEWEFDPLQNISTSPIRDSDCKYFRPEFLQTYSQGFREIAAV